MISVFIKHKVLTLLVLFLLVLSIACQIIIGVLYQNMIRATDNMTATDHKLLKQCKMKFVNCYKCNGGVLNIPIFVDKFLSKIRIGCFTLSGLSHLGGQLILLSVLVDGIGICKMIAEKEALLELVPFYVLSVFGLYLYFSVTSFVDATNRRKELKINLVDYLENHMVNRLALLDTQKMTEQEEGKGKERKKQADKTLQKLFTPKEEEELKMLLNEFF